MIVHRSSSKSFGKFYVLSLKIFAFASEESLTIRELNYIWDFLIKNLKTTLISLIITNFLRNWSSKFCLGNTVSKFF